MDIAVDDAVKAHIESEGTDFRLCTACMGPALVPIMYKNPKESDIKIPVGSHTLYISRVQARYIDKVTTDMIYDDYDIDSCPVFYGRH